jgi:hypothetical protein
MDIINKLIQYFRSKPLDLLILLGFLLVIIQLFNIYFSVDIDDGDWDEFKREHHCKMQLKTQGLPHTSWECDDGKVYYRWRQQR